MRKRTPATFETVRRIALTLPGVEEGTCYGTPAFRVKGRFLARLREDGETLAVKCGFDERDFRMLAEPATFFTTDHYRGYPTVLIRLASVRSPDLHDILEQGWRFNAPKKLLAACLPAASGPGASRKSPKRTPRRRRSQ